MRDFPHYYSVTANSAAQGDVELTSEGVGAIRSASPKEFDGPGNRWSPETLLVGAVADCLILTFRAVARASRLPWTALECEVAGTLDRVERATQFTAFEIQAHLTVPAGTDPDAARRALDKAERNCLISNSLKAAVHLVPYIEVAKEDSALAHA